MAKYNKILKVTASYERVDRRPLFHRSVNLNLEVSRRSSNIMLVTGFFFNWSTQFTVSTPYPAPKPNICGENIPLNFPKIANFSELFQKFLRNILEHCPVPYYVPQPTNEKHDTDMIIWQNYTSYKRNYEIPHLLSKRKPK